MQVRWWISIIAAVYGLGLACACAVAAFTSLDNVILIFGAAIGGSMFCLGLASAYMVRE
jgi:hypothetical protein